LISADGTAHQSGLSIFDLDRTLTRRATYSLFLLFAARRLAPWRLGLLPVVLVAMLGYATRRVSRKRLKEIMHAVMLGPLVPKSRLEPVVCAFAKRTLETNLSAHCVAQLRADRDAGRTIIIASASHHFYLDGLADGLGVTTVVATRSIWREASLTPQIDGDNCYGVAKRDAIMRSLSQLGVMRDAVHIRFYSDDISDLPSFDWADAPIAVNPSKRLRAHAVALGWEILG
jgi:HAD superfamily hydrolase (TIGR01490 family)